MAKENIQQLKQLFPEVFSEDKINYEKLKEILENHINQEEDYYNFTWYGKKKAARLAETPSTGTLRPAKDQSVDFDNTQNLFIEGDNLEVLKLLQKSYHRKVKMIYIDPPYNTGKDFIYKDNFRDSIKNYLQITGQLDENGKKLGTNSESKGRYHANWLNMMYPRLKLARNLLQDDGVIFISIDDNEINNLYNICNNIFGETNVEMMIWNKEAEGSSGTLKQTKRFRVNHEYIIVCYKTKEKCKFNRIKEPVIDRERKLHTANLAVNKDSVKPYHDNWMEIISPTGKKWNKHWKFNNKEIRRLLKEDLIYWGKDGNNQPRLIIPMDERRKVYPTSLINKAGTTEGRKDYETLMPVETFSYPKPVRLIKHLLEAGDTKNDLILDFFAGSGTTAHAVMQLNSEDKGNRKCISVQLQELTNQKSEAFKAGYKNIAEIAKERIRRAAKKIKEENPNYQGDLGFKVYKVKKVY